MKCANCSNPAAYIYQPDVTSEIAYCIKDIPNFLVPQLRAGHLKKVEDFDKNVQDAIDALPKVEEPVVEEEKAPTTKKSVKKTSAVEPDVE
jgi:hypothetical protein